MEVPLVGSEATRWTTVSIPGPRIPPASECSCIPPSNAGGAVLVPSASNRSRDCFIMWRLHESTPSVMEIVQLSSHQDVPGYGLRLSFQETLCPFADVHPIEVSNGQGLYFNVTLVDTTGIFYVVKLPVSSELWNNYVIQPSSLIVRDISMDLSGLRQVTSFAVAKNILFAAGINGSVLCFSLFTDPNAQNMCYELKGGDAGIGRLWGLVSRNKSVAAIKSLRIQEIQGKSILLALHEDGTLQAWDPLHHVRLFSHNICPLPELTGYAAAKMWIEDDNFSPSKQLAVLYVNPSDNGRETLCIYSLEQVPSNGFQLGFPTLQQAVPVDQGAVLDLKLVQGNLWLLKQAKENSYDFIHLKLQFGVLLQHYLLQEKEVCEQLIDDDVLEQLSTLSAFQSSMDGDSLSRLYLRRLLHPRIFHHETMQEVLREYGTNLNESNIRTLTEEDWSREITFITRDETTDGCLRKFNALIKSYISIWRKNHTPYALFADVTTGCVGIVRKISLSIIRSQTSIEKASLSSPLYGDGKDSQVLTGVFSCMREIMNHIGKFSLAIFHESLLQQTGISLDQLIGNYVRHLEIGFPSNQQILKLGLDEFRHFEKQRHLNQRKFIFRITQKLLDIKNAAGSWENILESVMAYESYLLFGSPQKFCRVPSSGNAFTKLITQATSQVLWSHFEEARNLVLLLQFILNLKSQVKLTANDASKIQLQILPRLKKIMLINMLLHWLTVTSGESPDSDDFNSLLSSLKIDGSKPTWKGHIGFGQITLADILASSFLESAPVTFRQSTGVLIEKGDILEYARGFITWLALGYDTSLNFPRRVISLSIELLQHGQYRGLEKLLRIAEKLSNEQTYLDGIMNADCESSARLHLLGLCVLARACTTTKDPNSDQIKEAILCFFRAAASNHPFHSLFGGTGAPHIDTESWKFHYFEWVMQIFEQHNLSNGATLFALAAIHQVDKAENNQDNAVSMKGRLWANIFKFSMDLELYNDAYCAIISNPDEEVKVTCLRRFVVVLCERKATQALCGDDFPYAGLLDTVEQELAWKADYSDISAKPSVYKLLYAFHIHRHNYRRAAGCMYRYAFRMKHEGVNKSRVQVGVVLQEQVYGLAAAINALSLVSSAFAWIDIQLTGMDKLQLSSPSKRPRLLAPDEVSKPMEKVRDGDVIDLEELGKEYVIAIAKLELVNANVKHPAIGDLSSSEVVRLLVQTGLYDIAFSTAFRLWKDSSLKRELEKMFELMARNCCAQQLAPVVFRPPNEKLLLLTGVEHTQEKSVDPPGTSASNWQSLQSNLEKYKAVHPRLAVVVAETILSVNRNMELPLWLVDMLKGGKTASPFGMAGGEGDPAALFRIYLDNGRLVEASMLLLEYLRAWSNMRPSDVIKRKKMSASWFPYTLIDRLLQSLNELSEKDGRCSELRNSIQDALQGHLNQMKADSVDVSSLARQS